MIGEALVPYYRQILPIFNLFKNKNSNQYQSFQKTSEIKQNIVRESQKMQEISSNKHLKYLNRKEVKMHILISSSWFLVTKAAFFDSLSFNTYQYSYFYQILLNIVNYIHSRRSNQFTSNHQYKQKSTLKLNKYTINYRHSGIFYHADNPTSYKLDNYYHHQDHNNHH